MRAKQKRKLEYLEGVGALKKFESTMGILFHAPKKDAAKKPASKRKKGKD
jgi:hypothetical protein